MSYSDITIIYFNGKPVPSAIDQSHLEEPWENYGGNSNIGYSEKSYQLSVQKYHAKNVLQHLKVLLSSLENYSKRARKK